MAAYFRNPICSKQWALTQTTPRLAYLFQTPILNCRLVSTSFIGRDPLPNTRRGPFTSGADWLSTRLDFAEVDYRQRLLRVQEAKSHSGSEQPDSQINDDAPASLDIQHGESAAGDKDAGAGENDRDEREAGDEEAEGEDENDKEDEDKEDEDENDKEDKDKEDEDKEDEDQEEDEEDLENSLLIIAKLRNQLGSFFPVGELDLEPSMLFHDDLNRHNILIDEDGTLAAIVDWECVSFFPLSIACNYPPFLVGEPLEVEPIKTQYTDSNGEVAEVYWEHLEQYELTQLRLFFIEEMRRLQPGWVKVFESSQRQRDFVLAVQASDDLLTIRNILSWLHDLESGMTAVPGLEERIDNGML